MKKLFVCVLMLALALPFSAFAEVDLSGMTYEELVALKDKINIAIWNSEEWQEVTVPQGRWIVGEDIPAGKWTIKCADVNRESFDMCFTSFIWGEALDEDDEISHRGRYGSVLIYNPTHADYEEGQITELTIELVDGDIVDIDPEWAPAVFSPYAGKPSLGFK